jgi:hypothetical protein
MDRSLPPDVDRRAAHPSRGGISLTGPQRDRGVVYAYASANPIFYLGLIDRLEDGERLRNVTSNHGTFEYSREEFYRLLPNIARSASFRVGSRTHPGQCRYVTGRPPAMMQQLTAPD